MKSISHIKARTLLALLVFVCCSAASLALPLRQDEARLSHPHADMPSWEDAGMHNLLPCEETTLAAPASPGQYAGRTHHAPTPSQARHLQQRAALQAPLQAGALRSCQRRHLTAHPLAADYYVYTLLRLRC